MLEAIDDAFKTWDEGSFYHPEDHGAWDAIRTLIESSGEKEPKEEALSYQPGPDIKPEGNNAPLSGPRAISNKEVEELENWEPDMEGIGGWTRNPAPSPAPSVERREGHCALKYDKTTRTIKTFDPNPAPLPKEVEEASKRLESAARNSHYADTHLGEGGIGSMGGAEDNLRLDLEAITILKPRTSPPLPKEVEEAIIRIEDCIEDAFAHRQNHTDKSYPIDEVQKDSVKDFDALAVIRAAIRPKVVSREWVEETATVIRNCPSFLDGKKVLPSRCLNERLREKGIEVER